MKSSRQVYDKLMKRAKVSAVLAFATASLLFTKPQDAPREYTIPDPEILPPNPDNPEYQRQQRMDRLQAINDTESQMRSYDINGAILRQRKA